MQLRVEELIAMLKLRPHPEGGFYRESYRSAASVQPGGSFDGPRSFSTAIYFLLPAGSFSALHRIKSDEIWHRYEGDPVEIVSLDDLGRLSREILGADIASGESMQIAVPANSWFGARVLGGGYALVGCTVSPGFDFRDFELGDRAKLIARYPAQAELIRAFTRES